MPSNRPATIGSKRSVPTLQVAALAVPFLYKLRSEERSSREEIKRTQQRRLQEIVGHAGKHVPYYKALFRRHGIDPRGVSSLDDLRRLPILAKEKARACSDTLISEVALRRNPRALCSMYTTGSSGNPLRVVFNRRELAYSRALALYGYLKAGRRLTDTVANICVPERQARGRHLYEYFGIGRTHAVDLRRGVESSHEALEQIRPQVVYSYPSFLALMARSILEDSRKVHRPRLIITNGETLTSGTRSLIQEAFQSEVRDSYGSVEFHQIAYECSARLMHVISPAVIVEVDENTTAADGSAEILVTGLYHKTMPFLRYRLGDRIVLSDEPCACGSPFQSIRKVTGRSDDFLTLPSGRRISARAVNLLEKIAGILEYQIIQRKRDLFEVLVKPSQRFDVGSEQKIKDTIAQGCLGEPVRVQVRKVDEVQRQKTGKLQAVISVAQ